MCNVINTHTTRAHPREDHCEWYRKARVTRPDCEAIFNLINTYIGDSLLFYSRHFHSARVIISADRGWS